MRLGSYLVAIDQTGALAGVRTAVSFHGTARKDTASAPAFAQTPPRGHGCEPLGGEEDPTRAGGTASSEGPSGTGVAGGAVTLKV